MAILFMDSFTNYTQEEMEIKYGESQMMDDKVIKDYIGEVVEGDFVIYAKEGDFSTLGTYKKDIWRVEQRFTRSYGLFAKIVNIHKSDTVFETPISNLLDVDVLRKMFNDWKKYFSIRSLQTWETLKYQGWSSKNHAEDAMSYAIHKIHNDAEEPYTATGTITLNKTGEVKMNVINTVIDTNVSAAKAGAVISAGNTLNKVVKKALRGQVPRKYRKVMDSPLGDVLVANAASIAVRMGATSNRKAAVAADAMMQASMVEFMNSFKLDTMISDVLAQVNIDDILPE